MQKPVAAKATLASGNSAIATKVGSRERANPAARGNSGIRFDCLSRRGQEESSAPLKRVAILRENSIGHTAAQRNRIDGGMFREAAQYRQLRD
jgi:hypothetical protein